MLVDLEGHQGNDGGQRRKDGSRQPFAIKNKQKTPEKSKEHPGLYIPVHPFHIEWPPVDLPVKFKVMGDRKKGISKKTKFSKD